MSPTPTESLIQVPHLTRPAEGIDISTSPELAGVVERDAFVYLSNWINDIIRVRVSSDTLRMTVGAIPGLNTALGVYDLVCDVVDLGTHHPDTKEWGYQQISTWVSTTIDLIGLIPVPPMSLGIKGVKPVLCMLTDKKFMLHHARDHLAAIGQGQALVWLEELIESQLPALPPRVDSKLKECCGGLQGKLNEFAQRPSVRVVNAAFGMFGPTPIERVNGVMDAIKGHGPEFVHYAVLGGHKAFDGLVPLGKRLLTKGRSTGTVPGNRPARPARAGESETTRVPRNGATGAENVAVRPQTEQCSGRHPSVAGAKNSRAGKDCGCQAQGPGNVSNRTERPVNIATGEEILYHHDFEAPGFTPVDFTRNYRSSNTACDDGPLGARWTTPYTTTISEAADGSLTYHDFMGRSVPLPALKPGQAYDEAFEAFTAQRESAQEIALIYRDGARDVFRRQGTGASLRYTLIRQESNTGPALHILPPDEARVQFKHRPLAAHLHPRALFILTDGEGLWLECHPADLDAFARQSLADAVSSATPGALDPLVQADQRAGIAYIAPDADPRLAPGAWAAALSRKIGRIDQLLDNGTRHTHARYTYAPARDERGVPLPGRLELVGQFDAEGRGRHYAYTQLPARDDAPGACHLLARYSDTGDFGLGFTQRLEWDSRAAWAPFPVRCTRTVAEDGSEDTRLAYRPERFETEVTDAVGITRVYQYNGQHLLCGLETRFPDGSSTFAQRIWNPQGQPVKEIDPEGRVTRMTYDERGNLLTVTDPAGGTTRYAYDAGNRPVTVTDPAGGLWQRRYDERGNLLAETDPAGRTTATEWDGRGQPVAVTDAGGGTTRLTWDDTGQLLARTDCSGKTTRYSYDRLGRLQAETDPTGATTRVDTDRSGRVTAVVRPDGARETYLFTPAGQLAAVTDPTGAVTRTAYNGQGLPVARTDPLGRSLTYHYNAALQLTALVNENGERSTFAYDAQGNLIRETGFDGQVTEYTYDLAGQLLESARGLPTRRTRTVFERDPLGRLLTQTVSVTGSPRQDVTTYRYDPLGRLIAAENRHATLTYAYDAAGGLIEETQHHHPRFPASEGAGPLGGRPGHPGAPGTGTIPTRTYTLRHELDALGHRVATVLPHGRRIDTQRYGAGHWIGTLWNGTPLVDLERDDRHRETRRQIGTRPDARLTRTRDYDAGARLARQRLTGADRRLLAQRTHTWDPAGRLTGIDDPVRGRTDYAYDPAGQLLRATRPGLDERFAWDPAGNLVDPAPDRHTLANTDGKDHAHWDEGLGHLTERPVFGDPPSPRPAVPGQPPQLAVVTRNLLKHYLDTRYEHDLDGNTVRKIQRGSAAGGTSGTTPTTLHLHYGPDHRLVKAIRPHGRGSLEADYAYDPFGRRIAKRVRTYVSEAAGTGTYGAATATAQRLDDETHTAFVWDGDTLAQEIHAERTVSYLYEPDSFVPLAQIVSAVPASAYAPEHAEADRQARAQRQARDAQDAEELKWLHVTDRPAAERLQAALAERARQEADAERQAREADARTDRIYHLDTDHLGTPQEAYADDGTVVWLAHYKAWGRIHKLDRDEIKQPFRFQGQYEDEETGLYYNRHRYYDPDSARYLTQDPIGLAGGNNLYAYTPNPTGWVDPLGLAKLPKAGRYHGPKPQYENPGHHDPSSGNFRGGGSRTSILPCHHARLAKHSVPDRTGKHWYAIDDKGVIHRLGNSNDGKMHWNGDTSQGRGVEVPPEVRDRLQKMHKDGKSVSTKCL